MKNDERKGHPVGEGVGAAGGAVTGLAVGASVGGPVGANRVETATPGDADGDGR